ncbi:LPS export ABC transporter periplasmic protein LptC [Halomonas heilongjiangensis]|uniref:LPS export ABC transporter periplasmic protein LptC n=1 Tax=Halomonas heilongjiangensis TaxID=1387883 RepID=A0A2N7TKN4_9GAMM|nr:LPS export ABC transporter periplasmic protein LptC [Halomonas heilongjiangensis]PMR68755.1 LPS export ABC transporter periplasmic protein LptC [Halomonas heilongjiangensis]PXX88475.1 LPS export ABC transporter periplasmic protein LptC [Halomonas heilongjiangensis]
MALRLPRPSFRVWLFLLLLALGGVLALLDQRSPREPGPVPRHEAGEPDYYLEGVRLTRFDAEGRAHQRLDTPRLVHTPHDDVTRMQTPEARLIDSSGRVWFGQGQVGTLGAGGNPLTLSGDARLHAPEEHWQLDTDILHFDADTGHAWSEAPALLRQPPQRMRGERFDAWIHDNRARLTDNVRGHHPPETPSPTDEDPES